MVQRDPPSIDDTIIGGDIEPFTQLIVRDVVEEIPMERILARAADIGPRILPAFMQGGADPGVYRMLGLEIIDRTPRPGLRFATRKAERPGRNEPCLCGSGRKYKQCCQALEHGDSPFPELYLLPYVLDCLPRKRWAELAHSAIMPDAVAHAANELHDDGESEAAEALLEPWFKGDHPLQARHEWLLDTLLDVYTALHRPRKKKRLLESALQRGDKVIRSAALQRAATMSADEGDYERAWQYFRQAQREHADSATLSYLEVTLLVSQGEVERARERARFWIARLTRQDAEAHQELIGLLRAVADQGERGMFEITRNQWPELDVLRELLDQTPAPALLHKLKHGDDESGGMIAPLPKLARALAHWRECFPDAGPMLTAMAVPDHPAWDDPHPWLDCLRSHPLLWQSFDVLDDLVLAIADIPAFGARETLVEPLLERAERLFDLLLDAANARGKQIEWGWHENRPALRLLAQRIVPDLELPGDETVARMEHFIALNPNDNHGFRSNLLAAYLKRGRHEDAVRLAQRYEDDTELVFGRALALWAQDRAGEALTCLQEAHSRLPRLLPMLLADKPRKPRLNPGFVRYGGADQAWLFRERHRPIWQAKPGALEWGRQAYRTFK